MYVKRFKLAHLGAMTLPVGYDTSKVPHLGWIVLEHEEILACGFFRVVEGDMMAVEGPYLKPDRPRAKEAGEMLEKYFMNEAKDFSLTLVRLKAYKP